MKVGRLLALSLGLMSVGAFMGQARAQDENSRKLKAYGSRVGDRDEDADNKRSRARRIDNRLDTRVDSRLNTRLERFSAPPSDEKPAYTPKVDDGTKSEPKR